MTEPAPFLECVSSEDMVPPRIHGMGRAQDRSKACVGVVGFPMFVQHPQDPLRRSLARHHPLHLPQLLHFPACADDGSLSPCLDRPNSNRPVWHGMFMGSHFVFVTVVGWSHLGFEALKVTGIRLTF